jgi:hypothetical protein
MSDNSDWGTDDQWGVVDESDESGASDTEEDPDPDSDEESQTTVLGILVTLAIGGTLIYGGLYLQDAQSATENTESVNATVIESGYTERGSGTDREFNVDVTYEFEFDGQTYRSSNVAAGPTGYTVDTRQRAELLITEQWAPENIVEAQVNPSDPETSYLAEYRRGEKTEESIGHYLLIGAGGLLILASIVGIIKKARRLI